MNNFHSLTDEQKRLVLHNAEELIHLPAAAIEKDMWVTTLLQILFSLDLDADILFKGGTSLSKIGNLIERFSEDIDIAIDPAIFGMSGDLTKKQLKNLRKQSSLYVKNVLAPALHVALDNAGLAKTLKVQAEENGEGDYTYPEPRRIFITYQSVLSDKLDYLRNMVVMEVGSRSLMEPTVACHVTSMIESSLPTITTSVVNPEIITAAPAKTFVEKACLLHELFSIKHCTISANRRSRHLYDLERMMDCDFAQTAIIDSNLWQTVQHHRSVYTSMQDIDYSTDFRKSIILTPPVNLLSDWEKDYHQMCETMIYGNKLPFDRLMERIRELEKRFHTIN